MTTAEWVLLLWAAGVALCAAYGYQRGAATLGALCGMVLGPVLGLAATWGLTRP